VSRRTLSVLVCAIIATQIFPAARAQGPAATPTPTVQEAEQFIKNAEARLDKLSLESSRAAWVQATYITEDTEALSAAANEQVLAAVTELANGAKRYDGLQLPPRLQRKFMLLKLSLFAPAPKDPKERAELAELGTWLEGTYGKGKYCPQSGPFAGKCLGQSEMEEAMATTRDPAVLLDLWLGWRKFSPAMRPKYARFVQLANKGAKEMGFDDVGALWRSNHDMSPQEYGAELERLWQQLRPLYLSLHAYVRAQLVKKYGPNVVPPDGPIPAHLLGNIWAQDWTHVYDLLDVPGKTKGVDLTPILREKKVDAREMVRYGERFFTSLGFEPLPQTFWERSLFTKPRDREVVCHASAWDIDNRQDVRLKMCIQVRDEDFRTIHHELGHNFYQLAYRHQPLLFKNGANDGFHEAVGDTIALSITPEYLRKVGLLEKEPSAEGDVAFLLKNALDKIAFLPFGLVIDEWRWQVFSGQIEPADYNRTWWETRTRLQGVAAPLGRTEKDFDPGAKFHVAGNVPYTRYFLATILQFQFQRGLCKAIGYSGPLYRCSIYGNKEAGARLKKMLEMGQSRPWPEALYVLMGERQMDASALLEYFAPLQKWLDEQNKGKPIGW
jgi:peptidyl-dipeptidase A